MFGTCSASPGPGVAVAGRASPRSAIFRSNRRIPGPGEAFRGRFSFPGVTKIEAYFRRSKRYHAEKMQGYRGLFGPFWPLLGLPGPGVAGSEFLDLSLLRWADSQPNPCSGDPFRGDPLFRKAAPIPKTVWWNSATPYKKPCSGTPNT